MITPAAVERPSTSRGTEDTTTLKKKSSSHHKSSPHKQGSSRSNKHDSDRSLKFDEEPTKKSSGSSKKHSSKSKILDESAASLDKSGRKKKEHTALPNDADQLISLATEDLFTTKGDGALKALSALLTADDTRDIAYNCHVAAQIGAPLVVVRQMKDQIRDTAVQLAGWDVLGRLCMQEKNAPWFTVIHVGALAHAKTLLTTAPTSKDVAVHAMAFLQIVVGDTTAAKLVCEEKDGGIGNTFFHLIQHNQHLADRAWKALRTLCQTAGTAGRKLATEAAGVVLRRERKNVELLKTILDFLDEMIQEESSIKGFVQGKGIESLLFVYFEHGEDEEDNPKVSRKAGDMILALAENGGSAGPKGIVESGILSEFATRMHRHQTDTDLQKRGCQLVIHMAKGQRKGVKESGILKVVSNLSTLYRNNKAITKLAHEATTAMVK